MKYAIRAFALASLCLCSGADAKLVTFQIPGVNYYVWPRAVNDKGQVVGLYADRRGVFHGFLVQPDGAVTKFSVPVTGIDQHQDSSVFTEPAGITGSGVVIGAYATQESSGGFVRAVDGSITIFGAGFGFANRSLQPAGVNKKGWSVGGMGAVEPFLRDPSGAIQRFAVPGAVQASPMVVNRSRAIAGLAVVRGRTSAYRAFFRPPHGAAVMFGHPGNDAEVTGINDAGTVVGSFQDADDARYTAFVRTSEGTFTKFSAPKGTSDTHAQGINNSGTIAGYFTDSSNVTHGFLRTADGTFKPFDIPGATATEIRAINDKGAIAGRYFTNDGVFGFTGKP